MNYVLKKAVYSEQVVQSFKDCYLYGWKGLNICYYKHSQDTSLSLGTLHWKTKCINHMTLLKTYLIAIQENITTQEHIDAIETRLITPLTTLIEHCAIYTSSALSRSTLASIRLASEFSFSTSIASSASCNYDFCRTYQQFQKKYEPIVEQIEKIRKQYEQLKPQGSL